MHCFFRHSLSVLLLGAFLLCPLRLYADHPATTAEETKSAAQEDDVPRLSIPGIRILDLTHGYFSRNVEGLSDSVDSYFGDDRIFEEASGTYVQVRGSVIYSSGRGFLN